MTNNKYIISEEL